jgi:hypothetical protein
MINVPTVILLGLSGFNRREKDVRYPLILNHRRRVDLLICLPDCASLLAAGGFMEFRSAHCSNLEL